MSEEEVRRLFGGNVKRVRLARGMSQFNLSMKTGLSHMFINDVERGKKWVSANSLEKLSRALEVELHVFFLPESGEASAVANPRLLDISESLLQLAHDIRDLYPPEPNEK